MGIKITTDMKGPVRVWRSDKNGYTSYAVSISKKEGDSWIRTYQPVRFKKGVEVQNGQEINILNAFPTVDSWVKDDKQFTKLVWMITEFQLAGENLNYVEGFSSVDDEVPF